MILVVGATGTLGREVVQQLTRIVKEIRAFTRNPLEAAFIHSSRVEIVRGDLDDSRSIKEALKGINKVFLATPSHPRQIQREANVVRAAADVGIKKIVKLSTLGANAKSPLLMSRWHGESERFIVESGLPYTFLRSHNFMQNTLNYAPSIVSENLFRAPLGNGKISMVDARDVAAVAVSVLTESGHDDRIYRLTGAEACSFKDVASKISDVIGRDVKYENISFDEAAERMKTAGMPDWQVVDLIKLYNQFSEGKGARITDDIERVLKKAPITFDCFVKDYVTVFKGDFTGLKPGFL